MPTPIAFDPAIGRQFVKYAHLVAGRGYVHNTLGNIVMRPRIPISRTASPTPSMPRSRWRRWRSSNIVITDVPTSRIVWGERMTSVGHNLSREILRLRPDINATIHVHDDATIALLGGLEIPARRTSSRCCRSIRPSCWASRCISCRPMSMSRPT